MQIKTFEELVKESIDSWGASGIGISNFNDGSVVKTWTEIFCAIVSEQYEFMGESLSNCFTDTATKFWLKRKAAEFDLLIHEARYTQGYIKLIRSTTTAINFVPATSVFATEIDSNGNYYAYATLADYTIPIGESVSYIKVQALEAGEAYNCNAGKITRMITSINGIDSVTNEDGWITQIGNDEEKTEDFRTRINSRWAELSTGSTRGAYISWALTSDSGVIQANANVSTSTPGQVDILIVGAGGVTPASLISAVQTYIDGKKPLTVSVVVAAPTDVSINVSATITPIKDYSNLSGTDYALAIAALQLRIETIIDNYISNLGLGKDFVFSLLSSLIMADSDVYSVAIYMPTGNLIISSIQIAKTGTVAVTIGEPSDE